MFERCMYRCASLSLSDNLLPNYLTDFSRYYNLKKTTNILKYFKWILQTIRLHLNCEIKHNVNVIGLFYCHNCHIALYFSPIIANSWLRHWLWPSTFHERLQVPPPVIHFWWRDRTLLNLLTELRLFINFTCKYLKCTVVELSNTLK